MTTPRDLLIVAVDRAAEHPVEPGDLSLALAGAELVDLLAAGAAVLDGDRVVPGTRPAFPDRLLDQAAAFLVRDEPYERVDDWLWRRGRDLSSGYLGTLEDEGVLARHQDRHWLVFRTSRTEVLPTQERHRAADRWACDEPVLAALGALTGLRADPDGEPDDGLRPRDDPDTPEATATVLDAVRDAIEELSAERERRDRRLDEAARDNVRRGY